MAVRAPRIAGQGKRTYARVRPYTGLAARTSLDEGREELCLRRSEWEREFERSVRRTQPNDRPPLHVRPGMEGRMRGLLVRVRSRARSAGPPGTSRCHLRGCLAGSLCGD